ncbi:penicillin-binding protein 2 [candidate division TA06 bacterium]|nr:penicillin-binding protein 2 [candidate division TA06 bacterium]
MKNDRYQLRIDKTQFPSPIRQRVVGWFCFLLWLLLLSRLAYIQVVRGSAYGTEAENQHRVKVPLFPERGKILDRNGRLLAGSLEVNSIYALPSQLRDKEKVAQKLAALGLGHSKKILSLLQRRKSFVWIRRDVEKEKILQVRELGFEGIGIAKDRRRYYPRGKLAGNLLGFVGEDEVGLEGVEYEYDDLLKGEMGWAILQRGARGGLYPFPEYPDMPPRPGKKIFLTIDADIQSICEENLEKYVERFHAKGGSILCLNPKTGELLAMANSPGYDPNRNGRGAPGVWRNRIITDLFEPGSTFKVVIDAAAVEKEVVELEERVDDGSGVIVVSGRKIRDPKKHGPYTFQQAVERSSNAASVRIAHRVGKRDIYLFARNFGFGTRTGINLPGEANGVLPLPEEWSSIRFANIALGHGLSGTVLQLSMAFGAIANDGVLLEPRILLAVGNADRPPEVEPRVVRRVISLETTKVMKILLSGVVERGTGRLASLPGLRIAGKTGTAQKVLESGGYSNDRLITSFVGFFPVENPILLIACIVDEPKGNPWGATVPAPLFREITQKIVHLSSYQPLLLARMK